MQFWHSVAVAGGALMAASLQPAAAEDNVIKIGVVAAESGAFVSAGNTIGAGVTLAAKEINDAGGIKIGGKTYKLELENRDDRTDVDVAIAAARELVNDIGVAGICGTESHDFSVSMTKITGPAKVLQFTGNSSLGGILDRGSVAPGGPDHYVFQTEPQEFQRSGSTARGVLKLLGNGDRTAARRTRSSSSPTTSTASIFPSTTSRRSRRSASTST